MNNEGLVSSSKDPPLVSNVSQFNLVHTFELHSSHAFQYYFPFCAYASPIPHNFSNICPLSESREEQYSLTTNQRFSFYQVSLLADQLSKL
jgi:hypothetical protein